MLIRLHRERFEPALVQMARPRCLTLGVPALRVRHGEPAQKLRDLPILPVLRPDHQGRDRASVSDPQNTAAKDGPEAPRRVRSDGDQFRVSFRRMGRSTGSGSLAMTCKRMTRQGAAFLLVVGSMVGISQEQTTPGSSLGNRPVPYGSFSPGYPPANYFNRMRGYAGAPRGAQTVTDYRPLIRAITSLPGWNGTPAAAHRPARGLPSVPISDLITADGKILWPGTTANDTRLTPARRDAEEAVGLVAREQATYGQATIRHVADARNKLTEFARQWLPSLKARDRKGATQLERFIVELQKTLATMTAHY